LQLLLLLLLLGFLQLLLDRVKPVLLRLSFLYRIDESKRRIAAVTSSSLPNVSRTAAVNETMQSGRQVRHVGSCSE
jgi:hypothetical protein